MQMQTKVTSKLSLWAKVAEINQNEAIRAMAHAIDNVAQAKAPVLTGALRSDGDVRKVGRLTYEVKYGDERVPYARRRHYENKKNPQTRYYLTNAGDEVVKRGIGVYL